MNPKPLPQVIHLPCRKCGATRKHFGSSVCWDCMTPEEKERLAHDDRPPPYRGKNKGIDVDRWWPQPKPPPYPADDEGDAVPPRRGEEGDRPYAAVVLTVPVPYPADDEGQP